MMCEGKCHKGDAPVGTIARRPDGGWGAHRTVGLDTPLWEYFRLNPNAPALRTLYDADSWPQIRPDQRPDQSGLDWFPPGEEPIVPRPDPTAQQEPKLCSGCYECQAPKRPRTPRELPSLDCEEARDGTVWEARYVLLAGREQQTPGWKFQHTQDGWVYEDGSRVLSPEFLTGRGPYTEVLGDPS